MSFPKTFCFLLVANEVVDSFDTGLGRDLTQLRSTVSFRKHVRHVHIICVSHAGHEKQKRVPLLCGISWASLAHAQADHRLYTH